MSWWESAYRSGRVNWDPGEYDGHLPGILERYGVEPCRVLDPGCGNGKSAVWLAEQGFEVLGLDMAPSAVSQARERARRRGVAERATFHAMRLPDDLPGRANNELLAPGGFGFIIERAFLQHLGHGASLKRMVGLLARALADGGLFYSLMLAAEGASGYWGITRWSEQEIRSALEDEFTILEMRRDVFTPGEPGSVSAWITVMKPARR